MQSDRVKLLNLDLSACLFELSLESLSVVLADSLFDSLGSAVNQSLSFLQTETGSLTNSLDDSDLVAAGRLQDNIELSLLFLSSACISNRTCNCNSSSSGNAELILYRMYEISKLEDGESL